MPGKKKLIHKTTKNRSFLNNKILNKHIAIYNKKQFVIGNKLK